MNNDGIDGIYSLSSAHLMMTRFRDSGGRTWSLSVRTQRDLPLLLGRRPHWSSLFYKTDLLVLSSPRAESARAFTGRWCPHSGRGEDFLTGQLNFFTETAVTPERKVEKWFSRWEINRHAEG